MSEAIATVVIDAPIAEVWPSIANVGNVHLWHPVVKASPVLTENATGLGATRRCEFYDGTSVVEKVVEVEEGRRVKLELSDFSMPLSSASGNITLVAKGDSQTEVVFAFEYQTKSGPIGWLMDATMIRPMMTKMLGKVVAGLRHHVQTGDYIGEHGPMPVAPEQRLEVA